MVSRLLATPGVFEIEEVGLPPSNGALVAVKFEPIALMRSLKAAVLLVPSVIAAMRDERSPHRGDGAVVRVDERPGNRPVPALDAPVAGIHRVGPRSRIRHVIIVAVRVGQPVRIRRAAKATDFRISCRRVDRVVDVEWRRR